MNSNASETRLLEEYQRTKFSLSEIIMPAKTQKNSLVGNINKRKKAGTSRSKAKTTISEKAYSNMQKGWPKKKSSK